MHPREGLDRHLRLVEELQVLAALGAIVLRGAPGYVCEAPGYNVFAVKRGSLLTPADNILMGITRDTVIELAKAAGLPANAGRMQVFDLYNADEVFLSSTAGGIVPVIQLDGRVIGGGGTGRITEMLRHSYHRLLENGEKSTPVHVTSLTANLTKS